MKKYLKEPRRGLNLLGVLGMLAGLIWLGSWVLGELGGDGESEAVPGTALAFSGAQDTWVPGQAPLTDDSLYLQIIQTASAIGDRRWAARLRLIKEIEERARRAEEAAARKAREEAERRRREQLRALARLRAQRLQALREARAKYREALRKAAEEKRKRAEELAEQKRKLAAKRRALERKRRIAPGEECDFESVRKQYDCEEGRL